MRKCADLLNLKFVYPEPSLNNDVNYLFTISIKYYTSEIWKLLFLVLVIPSTMSVN